MRAKRRGTRSIFLPFFPQVTLRDVSGGRGSRGFLWRGDPTGDRDDDSERNPEEFPRWKFKIKSSIDNRGPAFPPPDLSFGSFVLLSTIAVTKTPPRSTRVGGTGCWSKCAYRDWPAMTKRVVLVATRGYWFFDTIRQLRGGAVAAPLLVVHRHICFPRAGQRRLRKADFLRFVTDRRVVLPLRKYKLKDLGRSETPRDRPCVFRERKLREKRGPRALKQPPRREIRRRIRARETEHA